MTRATKNSSSPIPAKLPQVTKVKSSKSTTNVGSLDGEGIQSLSGEGKVILELLSKKLDDIVNKLDMKDARINRLEKENSALKIKISTLEERVENVEQHGRRNNLVLSGRKLAALPLNVDLKLSITELLKRELKVVLTQVNVLSVFRLGAKPSSQSGDTRSVMVKLTNGDTKRDILHACRSVRPPDLFANEDLTSERSKILFALRQAKKKSPLKVSGCGSRDGSVYVYLRTPNPSARDRRVYVNNLRILEELCTGDLGLSVSDLIEGSIGN